MKIHLVRHGETNWNKERRIQGHSESSLTPLGEQQAKALQPVFEKLKIARVYCSSSQRTRQTAEHIFAQSPVELIYADEFKEIFLGPWEAQLYSEILETDPEEMNHFWHEPHKFAVAGAETFSQLQERGKRKLDQIISAGVQGEEVVIVSHGAMIKAILCAIEKRPLAKLWEPPRMHNCAHSIVEITPQESPNSYNIQITQYADVLQ
jgi:broad specificity phosphatase PhoE